ncbi:MAG TPA: hypothetical protein VGY54_14605 [Polyangiaceae bacterium]|jgi:hypothetical protein|nr:hypothetical protein [Polyangiaceae bacterium]
MPNSDGHDGMVAVEAMAAGKPPKKKKLALTAQEHLALAQAHLERVQDAWPEPTDWSDLTIYGMYAIESATLAAAAHLGKVLKPAHWEKADFAATLSGDHGLPDVSELLGTLNTGRKAQAYGDEEMPEDELGEAEDLATEIEDFVSAIATFIGGGKR